MGKRRFGNGREPLFRGKRCALHAPIRAASVIIIDTDSTNRTVGFDRLVRVMVLRGFGSFSRSDGLSLLAWLVASMCLGIGCLVHAQETAPVKTVAQMEQDLAGAKGKERLSLLLELARRPEEAQAAIKRAEEALALAQELGAHREEGLAHTVLGGLHDAAHHAEDARAHYVQAAKLFEDLDDPVHECEALDKLAHLDLRLGQFDQALSTALKAAALEPRLESKADVIQVLNTAAIACRRKGALQDALAHLQNALALCRSGEDAQSEIKTLMHMGIIHTDLGDHEAATQVLREALALSQSADGFRRGEILQNLSVVCMKQGELDSGIRFQKEAIDVYRAQERKQSLTKGLAHLSQLYAMKEDFETAERLLREAADLARELDLRDEYLGIMTGLGAMQMERENYPEALATLKDVLKEREQSGAILDLAGPLSTLGYLYLKMGRFDQAIETYQRQIELARQTQCPYYEAEAMMAKSEARFQSGDCAGAWGDLKRYLELRDELTSRESQKTLNEMRTRYETEKKERENELLKKDVALKQATIANQRMWIMLVIALSLLGLVAAIILGRLFLTSYRYWKKSHFFGQYRIVEKIGEGGAGSVYRARDMVSGTDVALKVLHQSLVDEVARKRLIQERLASERLGIPQVVEVLGKGEHDDRFYLAMEYVDGRTLTHWIEHGPLSVKVAAGIFECLLDTLNQIHRAGVVHRDIKPDNIMIAGKEPLDERKIGDAWSEEISSRLKILDFGLARVLGERMLTRTAMMGGTLPYMAPEFLTGKKTRGEHVDFYSLGVVTYQMLTGHLPFTAEETANLIAQILLETPATPRSINRDVPEAFSDFVMKLIARIPSDRYGDGQAIASVWQRSVKPLIVDLKSKI